MKKFMIILLSAAISSALVFASASCAKNEGGASAGNEAGDAENGGENPNGEIAPEAQEKAYASSAGVFDWEGREFKILVNPNDNGEWRDVDYTAEEQNGDPINDAVYMRNAQIEAMFNIRIVPVHAADAFLHLSEIRKSVSAGDNAFDLSYNRAFDNGALAQEGALHDLSSIPELDLSQPWWDQNAVSELSINNRLYMVTGDIGTMYKKSVGVILFNKQMMQDYALGDPYQFVKDKKWTMDEFLEMCRTVSQDLDSNGKWDDNDKYGLLGYCDIIAVSLIGGGVKFAEKNSDDIPEITFFNEKTVAIFDKVTELLYKPELFWSWSRVGSNNERSRVMFANNQGLFNWNEFHSIPNLRNMETDFGILPMPLYDGKQDRYYHTVNPGVSMMLAMPASNPDKEKSGAVIAHMGAISKNTMTPAYYDISLVGKHARDDESVATMELIFDSMTYDPGYMYNWANVGRFTLGLVDTFKTDLASQYEKIASKAQTELEKMIDAYKSLD